MISLHHLIIFISSTNNFSLWKHFTIDNDINWGTTFINEIYSHQLKRFCHLNEMMVTLRTTSRNGYGIKNGQIISLVHFLKMLNFFKLLFLSCLSITCFNIWLEIYFEIKNENCIINSDDLFINHFLNCENW
jgi:hypothetical protein